MEVLTDQNWLLSLGTFLPLAGVLVMLFIPRREETLIKAAGIVAAAATVAVGIYTLVQFDYGQASKQQFFASTDWIRPIRATYTVGLDGISLPLYFLSMVITLLVMVYSWDHVPAPGNPKAFFILMLVLQTGMAGTFIAQDLILFFVFFELVLLPMYFMIGVWGGDNRQYASLKFFLYTMFGSALMLVSFIALFVITKNNSATPELATFKFQWFLENGAGVAKNTAIWIFAGMFIGFAVKVPMFPFHTWLPDAHTEAPTQGSVILAAILLKLGTYGFVRIALPFLPQAGRQVGTDHRRARRDRHHLRRARLPRPDRHETTDRVLLGRPHGLRDARYLHADDRWESTRPCSEWLPTVSSRACCSSSPVR
jgi:NADH-quinone oxidoreductase subunit M